MNNLSRRCFVEMGNESPPLQRNAHGGDGLETREAPLIRVLDSLLRDESSQASAAGAPPRQNPFKSHSPAESNHGQLSGTWRESPASVDPARLLNGNANHSFRPQNSRSRRTERRHDSRSVPSQRQRGHERELPFESDQAPRKASILSPVQPSKVAKARRNSLLSPRRPNASETPYEAQQSPSGLDIPEPVPRAAPAPPRRSRRLQEIKDKIAVDLTEIFANSPNRPSQPRPRGISTNRPKSAEPRGVSKRQRPSLTRRRAR